MKGVGLVRVGRLARRPARGLQPPDLPVRVNLGSTRIEVPLPQ